MLRERRAGGGRRSSEFDWPATPALGCAMCIPGGGAIAVDAARAAGRHTGSALGRAGTGATQRWPAARAVPAVVGAAVVQSKVRDPPLG